MNRMLTRSLVIPTAVIIAAVTFTTDVGAQTLTTNSDPSATLVAGVRYRNLGSSSGPGGAAEVFVFPFPCCGTTTNGQGTWPLSSSISISYNGSNLATTAAGTTTTRSVGVLGNLNYIQITITKQNPTTSVALNNISLGGGTLGSAVVSSAPNTQVWKITGADLTSGFTLTGTLATTGLSPGVDGNFVQVEVGDVVPPDNQGPVTSSVTTAPVPALLNGMVTVTANVSDEDTGNNNVASAEYQLNGGAGWTSMSASDGAFDTPTEDVEASFTALQLGTNEVCVRGTDAMGNTGVAACQTFLVTYKFTGFFSPVDNDLVNVLKAGQAVPAKWRLTDANDVPIADPASFVNLLSYLINCTDFAGDPLDSLEEVASGASGLQYSGDGYWQFNWKTPKTYADSCRAMYVEFKGGALSPVVKFQFKK
jgi:hypothetical protein